MKEITLLLTFLLLFVGCSKEPHVKFSDMPNTEFKKSTFNDLPQWSDEDYSSALSSFIGNCKSKKTLELYKELCIKAEDSSDAKQFFLDQFTPYEIIKPNQNYGLLTGYYEPRIRGSHVKKEPYLYPVYRVPKDLVSVELGSLYGELKKYRLRGRVQGSKLLPYYSREEIDKNGVDADVICYTDSIVDLFFLEVQGSGVVEFDSGEKIYIGYANQNGYKYKSIGKYLVDKGEIELKDISLQSIKEWLIANPNRVDEVLHYNKSKVFFEQREVGATGSLGITLTPKRSIAIDTEYVPLGSVLYLNAHNGSISINKVVMAQDTGGAIKGALRADIFLGHGDEAAEIAGKLKAPLKLWILLPNSKESL